MKLKYEFIIMDMGDEFAAVPVNDDAATFRGMLKMNAVAADILEQLKEETDQAKIHSYLKDKYPDAADDEIEQTLAEFLDQLSREGLL